MRKAQCKEYAYLVAIVLTSHDDYVAWTLNVVSDNRHYGNGYSIVVYHHDIVVVNLYTVFDVVRFIRGEAY